MATDLSEPIVGREVVLVDARGARQDGVTGSDGAFAFYSVKPPYDLSVARGESGVRSAYMGLLRRDPYLELFERSGPTPAPERQVLRVGVRASLCGAASCWVTASSASPSGSGSATVSFRPGDGVVLLDVEHDWTGASVASGELVAVHVLVGDDEQSWFAYGRVGPTPAAPGDAVDVGMADVAPVPMSGPVSVGASNGAGALTDWRWNTSVVLDLSADAGGGSSGFVFALSPTPSTTLQLPLVPRATMRVGVTAIHPRGDPRGGFFRSTESWSGTRPAPSAATLGVVEGPEVIRPAPGAGFSRRGQGFEWTAAGVALSTLTVVDTARGVACFRVLSSGHEVRLARLARLGIPRLDVGDHLLDLVTSPLAGIEDASSPDVVVRRRRQDRARPGMTTHLRVPFHVTR